MQNILCIGDDANKQDDKKKQIGKNAKMEEDVVAGSMILRWDIKN